MIVFAGTGVVGQQEAQRLARQHRLVDTSDLVRQRLHIGSVDRHHRIKQERKVHAFGFASELERRAIAVEREWALNHGHTDGLLVGASQKPLFHRAIGCTVDELYRAIAQRHGGHHADNLRGLNARKAQIRCDFI